MRFKATVIGKIVSDAQKFDKKLARATKGGIQAGTDGIKNGLRAQIRGAGMSQRLANTWRGFVYPKSGDSKDAAGSVVSAAPHIIAALDQGTTIRARNGRFLAVPLPETQKYMRAGGSRRRITPRLFQQETGIKLVFIPGKGGNAVLAAIGARRGKTGRVSAIRSRKATKRLGERSNLPEGYGVIPMFALISQSKVRKRLDVEAVARDWGAKTPRLIDQRMGGRE